MRKIFAAVLITLILSPLLYAQERPDALELYNTSRYEEAVEVCKQELELTPSNMDSYSVLCWSLVRLGNYDEALKYARQGMEFSRYDPRMVEVVGEVHFYQGRNLEALKWFEEYTVLSPTGPRIDTVYYLMGEIYIRLGEYNRADIAITTAVYHTPTVAQWWSRLGYAREQAGDYKYALEAYNEALRLKPGFSEAERGRERVREKMETG